VLVENGKVIPAALRHERLCEEDLLAAVECEGAKDFGEVAKAVLEPNGTIVTILKTPDYETQHFLALSKQIDELRTLVEELDADRPSSDHPRVPEPQASIPG
jgi:uncharacterized membrane protein YcaP (DUF421 family)